MNAVEWGLLLGLVVIAGCWIVDAMARAAEGPDRKDGDGFA